MKKLLAGFFVLTLLSFTSLIEHTYVWEHYGLEITVPDDFKVTKNTDNEFDLKGVAMGLHMYINEEDITAEEMDEAVVKVANSLQMHELHAATQIEGDGLDGFFVEGTRNDKRVVLAGMIDPKSHTNFLMLITFFDDDNVAVDDAVDIINSVKSTK